MEENITNGFIYFVENTITILIFFIDVLVY